MQTQTEPTTPVRPTATGTGEMCILDLTGDTKVIWDSKNVDEVAAAKATFDSLRAKGYLAYTVSKDGSKGEVIREFDEKAEKIILSAPLVGG